MTVPKLVAVNRKSKSWWIDGGDRLICQTYVWNSDQQMELELATMGIEIDFKTIQAVYGNTCYYIPRTIG